MADSKLYTVAGTSIRDGVGPATYRFSAGSSAKTRAVVLGRVGHTEVDLRELPNPMTKADAIAYLVSQGVTAVLPVSGRAAKPKLTPEQIKAAAEKAKRDAKNAKRREQRAAKKAAAVAVADEQFLSAQAGAAQAGADELLNEVEAEVSAVETFMTEEMAEVAAE